MQIITEKQIKLARAIAMIADGIQLVLCPFFAEGIASPLNTLLDVVVGISLTSIVGFHWSFVPAFCFEEAPILDEIPTWTLSVLVATSDRQIIG